VIIDPQLAFESISGELRPHPPSMMGAASPSIHLTVRAGDDRAASAARIL
jgi:hypothetical protein